MINTSWLKMVLTVLLLGNTIGLAQQKTARSNFVVELNKKFGLIDLKGNMSFPIENETSFSTWEGLTVIEKNGKYGYIDSTGKVAIPFEYDYAYVFFHGVAEVTKDRKRMIIDKNNKNLLPDGYYLYSFFTEDRELIVVEKNFMRGVIDRKGNIIIPFGYKFIMPLHEGLASVMQNDKYGYIDKSGKVIVPLMYDFAFDYNNGLAMVRLNMKYGLINKTCRQIIPLIYDEIFNYSRVHAEIEMKGVCQRRNSAGVILSSDDSNESKYFVNNYAAVKKGNKWGFISLQGKEIVAEYDSVGSFFASIALVKKGNKYGYIDTTGKIVIPITFDDARSNYDGGILRIKKNNKWGYITTEGEIVIPCSYDQVWLNAYEVITESRMRYRGDRLTVVKLNGNYAFGDFSENLVGVKKNAKWGFINKEGETIIPFIYDALGYGLYENLAMVRLGAKWGCIDKKGTIIIPIKYSSLNWLGSRNLLMASEDKQYGIINCKGETIIPAEYEEFWELSGGYLSAKKNGKWGVLDYDNNKIVDFLYDSIR